MRICRLLGFRGLCIRPRKPSIPPKPSVVRSRVFCFCGRIRGVNVKTRGVIAEVGSWGCADGKHSARLPQTTAGLLYRPADRASRLRLGSRFGSVGPRLTTAGERWWGAWEIAAETSLRRLADSAFGRLKCAVGRAAHNRVLALVGSNEQRLAAVNNGVQRVGVVGEGRLTAANDGERRVSFLGVWQDDNIWWFFRWRSRFARWLTIKSCLL